MALRPPFNLSWVYLFSTVTATTSQSHFEIDTSTWKIQAEIFKFWFKKLAHAPPWQCPFQKLLGPKKKFLQCERHNETLCRGKFHLPFWRPHLEMSMVALESEVVIDTVNRAIKYTVISKSLNARFNVGRQVIYKHQEEDLVDQVWCLGVPWTKQGTFDRPLEYLRIQFKVAQVLTCPSHFISLSLAMLESDSKTTYLHETSGGCTAELFVFSKGILDFKQLNFEV